MTNQKCDSSSLLVWGVILSLNVMPVLILGSFEQSEAKIANKNLSKQSKREFLATDKLVALLLSNSLTKKPEIDGTIPTAFVQSAGNEFLCDQDLLQLITLSPEEANQFDLRETTFIQLPSLSFHGVSFTGSHLANIVFKDCDLSDVNFSWSQMSNIWFLDCNLTSVHFTAAVLENCRFQNSQLNFVTFSEAILQSNLFWNNSLTQCYFSRANFFDSNEFLGSSLLDCTFNWAHMTNVTFRTDEFFDNSRTSVVSDSNFLGITSSNLSFFGTPITDSIISHSSLIDSRFSRASDTRFTKTYIAGAHFLELTNIVFSDVSLSNVSFKGASLSNVTFGVTEWDSLKFPNSRLHSVRFPTIQVTEGDFRGAYFDQANSIDVLLGGDLPHVSFASATGLARLEYKNSEAGLISLRSGFKKYGMRRQEREVNYAINHQRMLKLKNSYDFLEWRWYWFVGAITGFGLWPLLPLLWMIGAMLGGTIIYLYAIYSGKPYRSGFDIPDGIWIFQSEDSSKHLNRFDNEIPTSVCELFVKPGPRPIQKFVAPILNFSTALFHAFFFSAMVTFRIGWKDLSIGNWMSRLDGRGVVIKPTGWVRSFSGFQSVVGVILFALFLWSYFTLPLE